MNVDGHTAARVQPSSVPGYSLFYRLFATKADSIVSLMASVS